ncbi:hypothetical protein CXQ85_001309 [Candidozyma haemuli]|uniref:ubiquitinyl hydrolase 1 n=1 Tax=Candidozyma haemuli TaxID=45357 RepID=A0A2V1AMK5_9ASCO|nr:hypothetical protein CXQ85_001309 [[Candida] haemuloni]PVH19015.1 hypothetical protein CXQ85_001309 [[Candida] haemuloni]
MSDEYETPPSDSSPVEDQGSQLARARDEWDRLMSATPQNGDLWRVIPRPFWEKVCSTQASSLQELASLVGKIDLASLVDENGAMYPEEESMPCLAVSPELFHSLGQTFGINGNPVARNMLVDESGVSLERMPPFFILHVLSKETTVSPRSRYNLQHSRMAFSLSSASTFQQLHDAVRSHVYKNPRAVAPLRLWFIENEPAKDMPSSIPVSSFIDAVGRKSIVTPNLYGSTLRSQGIESSRLHLIVEPADRKTFLVDAYLASHMDVLDYDAITSSGGHCGLSNLGNTCYMNSALQCLTHIPELNYYFFFDLYQKELNTNNPLGYKGDVAVAFSSLLHKLYGSGSPSAVTPREFKYTVGRHSSIFHGFQQQDSQEFVSWLLDALHEDLNRIQQKPYCEKPELKDEDVNIPEAIRELAVTCWDQYKKRNDSVIVDLFTGMYQSTLVCPTCNKESMTFDPFNDLTLPLPVNKKWYHELIIVDLSGDHAASGRQPLSKLEVELNKSSNFDDLINYISNFLRVPTEHLFLFELFSNFFYRDFQENSAASKFYPINELISDNDVIVAYIIPHNPATDIIVPLLNTVRDEDSSYDMAEPFGIPLFVTLNKESDVFSFGTIREKLEQTVKHLTNADMEASYKEIKGDSNGSRFKADSFPLLQKEESGDLEMAEPDTEQTPALKDEDYDSDISLAHPEVGADFGFAIKYYEEDGSRHAPTRGPRRYQPGMRMRYQSLLSEDKDPNRRPLNIPQGRPSFLKLPLLADKLPDLKRKYYHYPTYAAEVQRNEKLNNEANEEEEVKQEPEHVSILHNRAEEVAEDSDANIRTQSDEDEESDSNYDEMLPLGHADSLRPPTLPPIPSSESDQEVQSDIASPGHEEKPEQVIKNDKVKPLLVDSKTTLVCEWDSQVFDRFFKDRDQQAWEELPFIANPVLEDNKRKLALQQKSTVSLYDCLRNFSTPEVLGEQDLWYCPRCKDHKRATKTIQIWSTGDILTIHLKRFSSARAFSDKINMVVDFPIEGLEMNEFAQAGTTEPLIYDLVAVDNHYGGLGGGHYTAYAKNFRDQKWYYFNDSGVNEVKDPRECIKGAAYLLFYKKRKPTAFAGGHSVEQLLREGRQSFESKLQNLKEQSLAVSQQVQLFEQARDDIMQRAEAERRAAEQNNHQNDEEQVITSGSDEDDLYADSNSSGMKKVRPTLVQPANTDFENSRKQRLLSRGADSPRSVNINHEYSSSVSNVASPAGSGGEVESPTKDPTTS